MSWKNNNYKKDFNHKARNKKRQHQDKEKRRFAGRDIEVYNGDVNGAIRKLKKVLERMDFQKELSKREFYEKPSAKKKRKKDQAIKREIKAKDNMIMKLHEQGLGRASSHQTLFPFSRGGNEDPHFKQKIRKRNVSAMDLDQGKRNGQMKCS